MVGKNKRTRRIDAWVRRHEGQHQCQCGCGEVVPIKREHYRTGVPKFLKGHNFQGAYNPKTDEEAPKEESAWDRLTEEEKARRLSLLRSFPSGPEHPNWQGGQKVSDAGYRLIRLPEHPYAVNGYFPEHRLIVENRMRETNPKHRFMVELDGEVFLRRGTVVHHRDENKLNNDISNLVLLDSQSTHLSWHMRKCEESEKFVEYGDKLFCPWVSVD